MYVMYWKREAYTYKETLRMVTLIHLLNENHIKLLCGCFYLVLAVA